MKKEENNEHEFLKELSPLLFEKRIVINPEPPIGYFENLSDEILSKIEAGESKRYSGSAKIIQFINIRNIAIAAAIALLIALIPFCTSQNSLPIQTSEIVIDSETEIAELNEYVDESDIYSAFSADEISNISVTNSLNDEDIINYLMYEDYNEDLLIEMR